MSHLSASRAGWSMLVLAGMLLFAGAAPAQTVISGRVVDPAGNAVPGIEVLLHSITETFGTELDQDTSSADGTFNVAASEVDASAVYFVTAIYEGQLFIGDMLRVPFEPDQEYIIRVGVNPIDFSGGAGLAVPPAGLEQDRTAGIVVVIVAIGVIGGILYLGLRRRPSAQRRWLVELARLEEELAAHPDASAAVVARRAELRDRLKGRASD